MCVCVCGGVLTSSEVAPCRVVTNLIIKRNMYFVEQTVLLSYSAQGLEITILTLDIAVIYLFSLHMYEVKEIEKI